MECQRFPSDVQKAAFEVVPMLRYNARKVSRELAFLDHPVKFPLLTWEGAGAVEATASGGWERTGGGAKR